MRGEIYKCSRMTEDRGGVRGKRCKPIDITEIKFHRFRKKKSLISTSVCITFDLQFKEDFNDVNIHT